MLARCTFGIVIYTETMNKHKPAEQRDGKHPRSNCRGNQPHIAKYEVIILLRLGTYSIYCAWKLAAIEIDVFARSAIIRKHNAIEI